MVDKVTATEFDASAGLPDWRVLLGRIEANFRAGSFEAGASFVGRIAAAAEAANHHPDVDLRYPDRVSVALVTHAANGLTQSDVALARTISQLAAADGIRSEPNSMSRLEVAIDAIDIDAVRPFWQAVLGYVEELPRTPGGQVVAIVDPDRIGPAFWFQQMDAPRPQRNRIHLDVTVPHDVADERVAAALAAGGTLVSAESARAFWILADPEGNEACVCTWQDRG
ncbi:MAG TPA: VOC family protein [Ilumatobacteraceae bacterium]|nr:VOC family protein [Ilumatobacteraceae bacterium]